MKNRPPCLAWREKLALRHEDLSLDEQQALDAHLQNCPTCTRALADYHYFEARLDALSPPAIKPLPRLAPHFFDLHAESEDVQAVLAVLPLVPKRARAPRPALKHRGLTVVGRVLSVAVLVVLLLASGLLFHAVYQSKLAAHPGGDTLLNLNQQTGVIYGVAWSPDGNYLATASADHTVKVWSAASGDLICTYTGDGDVVYALAWSPNGEYLASGGADNTVQIWYPRTCSGPVRTYIGHTNSVQTIAWSPDNREIISGSWDHTVRIWDVASGKTLYPSLSLQFSDEVYSVAWSSNGQRIAIGDWNEDVEVLQWNPAKRNWQKLALYRDNNSGSGVNTVAWSHNGEYLAEGNQAGVVTVRKISTSGSSILMTYRNHTDSVNAVAWSPNGQLIASASNDDTVRVWSPFSGKTLMIYSEHTKTVNAVAWSPDGMEIISGSDDLTAKVWKVEGE